MTILFYFTSDETLKAVKRESSYLAKRRTDESGDALLDELVYDEEYEELFRDHFLDARAKVVEATLAYGKSIDVDDELFELNELDSETDFVLYLAFPDTFAQQMKIPMTSKIREFLVSYIMYRWLETKLPKEAATFYERAEQALRDVRRYADMRTTPYKRTGRFY